MVLRPEDLVRHITPTVEQEREAKQFILKAFLGEFFSPRFCCLFAFLLIRIQQNFVDCYQHVITQEHQHMLNKERRLDESFAHQTTKTSLDDAMMDVNNLEKAIVTGAEIVVDESLVSEPAKIVQRRRLRARANAEVSLAACHEAISLRQALESCEATDWPS